MNAFRSLNRGWEERGVAFVPLEGPGAWLPDAAEPEKPREIYEVTENFPLKRLDL